MGKNLVEKETINEINNIMILMALHPSITREIITLFKVRFIESSLGCCWTEASYPNVFKITTVWLATVSVIGEHEKKLEVCCVLFK